MGDENEIKNRLRGSFGSPWIASLFFSTVGLLTMVSQLHGADGSETWVRSISEANLDSIVFINVKAKRANGLEDTITGTGFIVDSAGYVLTCNDVIPALNPDYDRIESTGSVGGRYENSYPLTIVSRDEQADLRLLKLPQTKAWRSVKSMAVAQLGSDIVALGFPLDKDLVEAPGSITGIDNHGRLLASAALAPGMSGAPYLTDQAR